MTDATQPILAAVIGNPVAHSLSPTIHNNWAARAGVRGYYVPILVGDDDRSFQAAIDSLQTLGFAGANVTIPHKERALKHADNASDFARAVGAANMLTFKDGTCFAENSDGEGYAAALAPMLEIKEAYNILILGAGGAARAIAARSTTQLIPENKGKNAVTIINRTLARANNVAALCDGASGTWDDYGDLYPHADIIVNTTSLGMSGQPPLNVSLENVRKNAVVFDIVYSPLETDFMSAGKKYGARAIGGLDMLMHQAAPGFRKWFNADCAIDDELHTLLLNELSSRGHR